MTEEQEYIDKFIDDVRIVVGEFKAHKSPHEKIGAMAAHIVHLRKQLEAYKDGDQ